MNYILKYFLRRKFISSNSRLLKKMRKVIWVAVASSSLVACSSQVSCAVKLCSINAVRYTFDEGLGTLIVSGKYKVPGRMGCFKGSIIFDELGMREEDVKNITICEGVTEVGNCAFCYCKSLEIIVIPQSVTKIGKDAFCSCENLKTVNIPDGVIKIGDKAFFNCESLKKINVQDANIKYIGDCALEDCRSLVIDGSWESKGYVGYKVKVLHLHKFFS